MGYYFVINVYIIYIFEMKIDIFCYGIKIKKWGKWNFKGDFDRLEFWF